ncbi:riboflavin kinase [Trapelia coarctata]|nr:riboflavin kinase [Trapelia coarctata]
MRPEAPRPLFAGPEAGPEAPFPLRLGGRVVKGFGRGSSELGIPTANIPIAGLSVGGHEDVESGVYFGWAGLDVDKMGERIPLTTSQHSMPIPKQSAPIKTPAPASTSTDDDTDGVTNGIINGDTQPGKMHIYPMVMSIGWNPFYHNTVRSVEVHILHSFPRDFYGAWMNLLILGFIRPEYDYVDKEALIEDIRTDIEVARRSLGREGYVGLEGDGFLRKGPEGEGEGEGVGR